MALSLATVDTDFAGVPALPVADVLSGRPAHR
jgi:hypothetical protein